ncbi:MAG TPA: hypothetical protein PLZ31_02500 [Myxococcota bacterium]|nr:hypothetical protein [Myxococcota bacterium]HPB50088.1 hypothetical protein [Myxococcota bacterium]
MTPVFYPVQIRIKSTASVAVLMITICSGCLDNREQKTDASSDSSVSTDDVADIIDAAIHDDHSGFQEIHPPEDIQQDSVEYGVTLSNDQVDFGWRRVGNDFEADIILSNNMGSATRFSAEKQPNSSEELSVELVGSNPVATRCQLTIRVRWHPMSESQIIQQIGIIVISNDRSDSIHTITVTGGATIPSLTFLPESVHIMTVGPGDPVIRTLTVKNTGKVPFTLIETNVDCSDFLTGGCELQECPLTVCMPGSQEPLSATVLVPDEFINLDFVYDVPAVPGCNQGTMVVNFKTDIRQDDFSVNVQVN